MLRELMALFSPRQPLAEMGENFVKMLDLTSESVDEAGELFFGPDPLDIESESRIRQRDVEVNKLQRKIRRQAVAHLSLDMSRTDVPYCLLLMSLVKDVERLGDYAKNLAGIRSIHPQPLPDDDIVRELAAVRNWIAEDYKILSEVIENTDRDRADALIVEGRKISRRLDAMIVETADRDYPGRTAAVLVLGIRFYKRIVGHVINLLTGVVQPLHKLDYYDED
ncbi:MAG: PhoU domain-containing protein [Gemmatimonadota bacterium]